MMTMFVLLGMILIGWELGRYLRLSQAERVVLSGGLGYAVSAIVLQGLWISQLPFLLIGTLWWLSVGSIIGWRSLDWWKKRKSVRVSVLKFVRKHGAQLQETALRARDWPLVLMGAISLFSVALMVLWSLAVRPVTWDNLTLYDARARIIAQGQDFSEVTHQFAEDSEVRSYNLIHPMGSSLIFALAYQGGGDFVLSTSLPLLVSVLLLPLLLWKHWQPRIVFWFLFSSSRLIFERSVENYAVWPGLLMWILGLGCLQLFWERKEKFSLLMLAGLFVAGSQTMRTFEPFWPILSVLITLWMKRENMHWKKILHWQVLPWMVYLQWNLVRWLTLREFASDQLSKVIVPINAVSMLVGFSDVLLMQRDFWPFVILVLGLLALVPKLLRERSLQFFAVLMFAWLGLMLVGAAHLVLTAPSLAKDFAQAWPRASAPLTALLLLFFCDLLAGLSLKTPRFAKLQK